MHVQFYCTQASFSLLLFHGMNALIGQQDIIRNQSPRNKPSLVHLILVELDDRYLDEVGLNCLLLVLHAAAALCLSCSRQAGLWHGPRGGPWLVKEQRKQQLSGFGPFQLFFHFSSFFTIISFLVYQVFRDNL